MKRTFASLLLFAGLVEAKAVAAPQSGYHIIKKVSLPGSGGWDYVFVDALGRRVYVSHSTQVEVLDADTFEPVGSIPDTPGVHGITVAPEFGRGFITAGKSDSVVIFDLKSLKPLSEVKVGRKPDAILYDPATKHVYAMNGESDSASVINAADGKLIGTVALGGNNSGYTGTVTQNNNIAMSFTSANAGSAWRGAAVIATSQRKPRMG